MPERARDDSSLGALLREYRRRALLTQEDLSARTGLSERTVRRLESNQLRQPRPGTIRVLADALGLDAAEQSTLIAASGNATVPIPRSVTPRQLPADVSAFTGRVAELSRLDALLDARTGSTAAPAIVVSAVSGTAGVGKTALALHVAHRVAHRYPDGQLYVNLRGYDPDQPMTVAEALTVVLTGLGVRGQDIPPDVEARSARYRTETAGRRLLIVLDNASSVEQVRPLLPGTASCAVLVTSRDALAGLVAIDGAHRVELDLLPMADAVALLDRLIGARVAAEADATVSLAQQCARLPLALRVAAELAVARPTTSLAELVTELTDEQHRLDLLDAGGDRRAAVTGVFSWSLRRLPPGTARTFTLLGLHPGPDFDAYAAAALADIGLRSARRHLRLLAGTHLIEPIRAGRYGMHDLLRAYATSLAAVEDTEAARQRLFDYYLGAAAVAMNRLYPAETSRRPWVDLPATPMPDLTSPDAAQAWLDAERPGLVVLSGYAPAHGGAVHTVRLSPILFRDLAAGRYTDALLVHERAHRAARSLGDRRGEGHALLGLVEANLNLGRTTRAAEYAWRALALLREIGDHSAEARAHYSLGMIDWMLGRHDSAVEHAEPALALARQIGESTGRAKALSLLGLVAVTREDMAQAGHLYQRALTLYRRVGDQPGEGYTLHNLGCVEERLGHYAAAANLQRQALELFQQLGDRAGEAAALDGLAVAHTGLREPEHANRHLERALIIARDIGDRRTQRAALNSLGEVTLTTGGYTAAIAHHTAALAVAVDTEVPAEQARAHAGLGRAHLASDNRTAARAHFECALTLYTKLGLPEAETVRAHLADLD